MTQTARKLDLDLPQPPRLSVVPPALREFILRVDGEYSVSIEAHSIEDAAAFAQAGEYEERRRAQLSEVGGDEGHMDLVVG